MSGSNKRKHSTERESKSKQQRTTDYSPEWEDGEIDDSDEGSKDKKKGEKTKIKDIGKKADKEKERKEKEKKEKEKKEKEEKEQKEKEEKEQKEKEEKEQKEKEEKEKKEKEKKEKEKKEKEKKEKEKKEKEKEKKEKEKKEKEKKEKEKEKKEKEKEKKEKEKEKKEKEKEKKRDKEKDKRDKEKDKSKREKSKDRDSSRKRSKSKSERGSSKKSRNSLVPTEAESKSADTVTKEKAAEEEYRKKVEEQLRRLSDQGSKKPLTAEERKARRAAILNQHKKLETSSDGQSESKQPESKQPESKQPESKQPESKQPESKQPEREKKIETQSNGQEKEEKSVEATKELSSENGKVVPKSYDMFNDTLDTLEVGAAAVRSEKGDDWDDPEGFYKFRPNDLLNERYQVFANQGRGVFSSVLRVRDTMLGNRELVVKVIRNNETMLKAGRKELQFLNLLAANDPENKRHCIRLQSHFDHLGHLCLVFEPMHMNLRELLKKFGGVGLHITAVRSFAKQLFTALRLLKKCGILHGDIKPDNVLVNESMNVVKLCDFGSAGRISKCEITPYLVSRFYRAPEIMLGLRYNEMVDVWSMGTVLYELYTGKILFNGKDNNEMLKQIQDVAGCFTNKMIKKGQFGSDHFDEDYCFKERRTEVLTKQEIIVKVRYTRKPNKDLLTMLLAASKNQKVNDYEKKKLKQFADLLQNIFILQPERRISVEKALHHPFIRED